MNIKAQLNAAIIDITSGFIVAQGNYSTATDPLGKRFKREVACYLPRNDEGRLIEDCEEFKAVRKLFAKHYFERQAANDNRDAEYVKVENNQGALHWYPVADIEGKLKDDVPRFKFTAKMALDGGKFDKLVALDIIKPMRALIQSAERQAWNACKAAANPKKLPNGKREPGEWFADLEVAVLAKLEKQGKDGQQVAAKADVVKTMKLLRKQLAI